MYPLLIVYDLNRVYGKLGYFDLFECLQYLMIGYLFIKFESLFCWDKNIEIERNLLLED